MRTLNLTLVAAIAAIAAPKSAGAGRPDSSKSNGPAYEAKRAYRATIRAFNQSQAKRYAAGFTPQLDCFYNRKGYGVDKLLRSRTKGWSKRWPRYVKTRNEHSTSTLDTWHLAVVEATPRLVALVDYGRWTGPGGGFGTHAKYIVMRKAANSWRVAAEFGRANKKCSHHSRFAKHKRPKRYTKCAKALKKTVRGQWWAECKKRDFGSNGCQMLQDGVQYALNTCWRTGRFDHGRPGM